MTPGGQRTRETLLDAGIAVAERHGLSGLSVGRVMAEAGLAKGTFYVHFADRDAFIDSLHQRFYARVSAAVTAAVRDLPPGTARLGRGIEAYLDACLADRAVKALVLETKTQGSLTTTIADREALFCRLAEPSLKALGWHDARFAARLFVAMTSEVALVELEAGRRVPAARRSLRRLVELAARPVRRGRG